MLPKPDRRFEPGGKGHQRRQSADDIAYNTGWDAIFGKKPEPQLLTEEPDHGDEFGDRS